MKRQGGGQLTLGVERVALWRCPVQREREATQTLTSMAEMDWPSWSEQ